MVDSLGDNLLADFASVVNAVQCAVKIQKELDARNKESPENRRMEFRIDITAQGRAEVKPSQKGELSSLSKHSEDPGIRGCRVLQKKATAFLLNALAASMKKQ